MTHSLLSILNYELILRKGVLIWTNDASIETVDYIKELPKGSGAQYYVMKINEQSPTDWALEKLSTDEANWLLNKDKRSNLSSSDGYGYLNYISDGHNFSLMFYADSKTMADKLNGEESWMTKVSALDEISVLSKKTAEEGKRDELFCNLTNYDNEVVTSEESESRIFPKFKFNSATIDQYYPDGCYFMYTFKYHYDGEHIAENAVFDNGYIMFNSVDAQDTVDYNYGIFKGSIAATAVKVTFGDVLGSPARSAALSRVSSETGFVLEPAMSLNPNTEISTNYSSDYAGYPCVKSGIGYIVDGKGFVSMDYTYRNLYGKSNTSGKVDLSDTIGVTLD